MKAILAHFVVFFYIYSITFNFIPISASTTLIFGVLGFIPFILKLILTQPVLFNKRYLYYLLLVFVLVLVVFISTIYNLTSDYEMLIYVIYFVITFFSSYFVITFLRNIGYKVNFDTISALIINVILIQAVIAIAMFYIPTFGSFINQIERVSESELNIIENVSAFRVTGFGTRFFEAGVISGVGLILIGIKIRANNYSLNQLFIFALKFLLILAIGSMMARTTLVGAFLGILLMIAPKHLRISLSSIKTLASFLSLIIVLPFIIITALMNNNRVKEVMEPVFNFAFEVFINFFQKGEFESKSTNHLQEMYILPSNVKTWIIGDGYWLNPVGSGYYMQTDVGYLRMIYYYGIIGLILFIIINYYSITLARDVKLNKTILVVFMAYLLLLNLKGYIDITSFTLLLSMGSMTVLRKKHSI